MDATRLLKRSLNTTTSKHLTDYKYSTILLRHVKYDVQIITIHSAERNDGRGANFLFRTLLA